MTQQQVRPALSAEKRALLERWRAGQGLAPAAGIVPGPFVRESPATFEQDFFTRFLGVSAGNIRLGISFCAIVAAPVDPALLRRVLEAVAQRHETLRTTFHNVEGRLHQRVGDSAGTELQFLDMSEDGDGAEARAIEHASAEAMRAFDVETGPLVRGVLYRITPDRHLLFINAHHMVADGWSLGVAVTETAALYDAMAKGRPSPLAPLPIQFRDFAAWHRAWLAERRWQPKLDYWRRTLDGLPAVEIPTASVAPAPGSQRYGNIPVHLPSELSASIRSLGRSEQATPFMTLVAGIAALMRLEVGWEDFGAGTSIANRPMPETYPLIGYFASSLVLRLRPAGNPTFAELLRHVRDVCVGAFANQEVTEPLYLTETQGAGDSTGEIAHAIDVGLQPRMRTYELAGVPLQAVELARTGGSHDFLVDLWDQESEISGRVEYSREAFDDATARRMLDRLARILARASEDSSIRLSRLP